jgi:hypothetical protein
MINGGKILLIREFPWFSFYNDDKKMRTVVSRNHLISHLNIDVSELSNRDQWLKEKPASHIARDFQIPRQQVYQLTTPFKEIEDYPELKSPGRRPMTINPGT